MKAFPLWGVVLLSGCSNFTVLNPKGQVGADEKSLILTAFALMLIVVIPVFVMTVLFAWRYRSTNTKAKYAPEWAHSRKIETIIWVVPCVIVVAIGYLAWTTSHRLDPFRPLDSTVKPIIIEAVSLDWKWLFIYPDQKIATVNEVAFPANVPVNFYVTSDTVMNSFFIPQLGSQIYSMAGMQTQLHLIANTPGTYDGISSNFSGQGFSGMKFKALAISQDQFNDWLKKVRESPQKLDLESYNELAKPSEYAPVAYYSAAEPKLFSQIIDKYMSTSMNQMGGM